MEDQIYITIAKSLNGEATAAEQQELNQWLMADPANAATYEDMKVLWKEADKVFETPEFNPQPAWEKVAARIATPAAEPITPTKKGRTIGFQPWVKYSIGLAAILLIAVLVIRPLLGSNTVTIAASDGNRTIDLPDHSHVTLRKGSSLRYPKAFAAAQRSVSLEGEAFFEVARNEHQPFVIDAQSASVKVLGTSFNVICSPSAASVTVATGRVQMSKHSNAGDAIILTPGKKGILKEGHLSADSVTNTNYLYWKTGELNYVNTPLSDVVADLGAIKDTAISLNLPQASQDQVVNISFKNQSLEEMLSDLCLIARCQWVKQGNTYVVRAK
jgi:ferric-dicitrate binding protein FerR (iron transport regulator)